MLVKLLSNSMRVSVSLAGGRISGRRGYETRAPFSDLSDQVSRQIPLSVIFPEIDRWTISLPSAGHTMMPLICSQDAQFNACGEVFYINNLTYVLTNIIDIYDYLVPI